MLTMQGIYAILVEIARYLFACLSLSVYVAYKPYFSSNNCQVTGLSMKQILCILLFGSEFRI